MKHSRVLGNLIFVCLLAEMSYCLHQFSSAANNFEKNTSCNHQELDSKKSIIFAGLFPISHAPHFNASSQHSPGKFNIAGCEEALAMIYALEQINNDSKILPGIIIGKQIIDTCSSVDVAIRKCLNLSFVRKSVESFTCNHSLSTAKSPQTVVVIGPGSTDVAMAVTDLAGLFHVPVIGYASSSRLLSNRARFRYFLRTVSSDTLMARVVRDLLHALRWNFIHALYSDTDYGRSAIETFHQDLALSRGWKICVAVEKAFTKQTSLQEMDDFINDTIQAGHNAKAKAVLLFTTIEDTELILAHFERLRVKDYVFISTDHYFGPTSRIRSSPEMLRRVIGIIPNSKQGHDRGFVNYMERFKKNPFNCSWISEYTELLDDISQNSTYIPYVIDAVYAAAYGLHDLLNCSQEKGCQFSTEDFPVLNR